MSSFSSSRRRSRISHFKAPFIVSVAGPAALGFACGGAADADPNANQGAALAKSTAQSETKRERTFAPPDVPESGMPCAEPELPSESIECGPNLSCVDGQWVEYYLACNPPERIEVCPVAAPDVGTSCGEFAGDLTCAYEYCYEVTPMRRCDAATGLWEQVPVPTCNPPPPPPPSGCAADLPDAACPPAANAPDGGP